MPCKRARSSASLNRAQAITAGSKLHTRLFTIKGRVQGVWFRDSTRREAERLELSGYARNLPNSDVEVLASGTEAALNELSLWLQAGPPLAKVSEVLEDVGREQADMPQVPAGFEVC